MGILEFNDRLISETEKFLTDNKTNRDSEKLVIFVMLHYLTKSFKLIKGINLLCKAKLESNAKILLRTLFEAFRFSAYVADDPKDIIRAEDCVIRAFIAERKRVRHMQDLGFFNTKNIKEEGIVKKILDNSSKIREKETIMILNYKGSINRLKKRLVYNNLTDEQIQDKFEKEIDGKTYKLLNSKYGSGKGAKKNLIYKYYAVVIRDSAAAVHCNDLYNHVHKNETGDWEIFKDDRVWFRDLILRTSANLFIQIMHNTNETLKLGKDMVIQELDKEYNTIIQEEAGSKTRN